LLVGLELETAANYLIIAFKQQQAISFQGVLFHGRDGWQVMDNHGFCEPKATSPIKDHEAFVIFDEARCRCAQL
jgi:hypothetical protein